MGNLLFIALGVLVVWYVVNSFFSHGHSSEYKEFAKEQALNKARKEARQKEQEVETNETVEKEEEKKE